MRNPFLACGKIRGYCLHQRARKLWLVVSRVIAAFAAAAGLQFRRYFRPAQGTRLVAKKAPSRAGQCRTGLLGRTRFKIGALCPIKSSSVRTLGTPERAHRLVTSQVSA